MGKIGNIDNLNLENYLSVFEAGILILIIMVSVFLKMLPFEIRNVEIELIQFDTKWYLFEIS
jgi:hypothetical protein